MTTQNESQNLGCISHISAYVATDVGKCREENQDFYGVIEKDNYRLFLVADGMGGARGGSIASRLAVEVISNALEEYKSLDQMALVNSVKHANSLIFEKGMDDSNLTGMGTTLVGLGFSNQDMFIVNVGDSRAYLIRKDTIRQLSSDHTLIGELIKAGAIDPEQANQYPVTHMLTRSLGPAMNVEVDCSKFRQGPIAGDTFLLCSDGLYNLLSENEILNIVNRAGSYEDAVNSLIAMANDAGGKDNITALLVKIGDQYPVKDPPPEEQYSETDTLSFEAYSARDDLSTLELPENGTKKVNKKNTLKRYRDIYQNLQRINDQDRQHPRIKLKVTWVVLFVFVVGSVLFQVNRMFIGNSREVRVAQTDNLILGEPKYPEEGQNAKASNQSDFAVANELLLLRLGELQEQALRYENYRNLMGDPKNTQLANYLDLVSAKIKIYLLEISRIRNDIDITTRELTLWFGKRQRAKDLDILRSAKEVADLSSEMRKLIKSYEDVSWKYLNLHEQFKSAHDNSQIRSELAWVKQEREDLGSKLTILTKETIANKVDSIDHNLADLTLRRDAYEALVKDLKVEQTLLAQIRESENSNIEQMRAKFRQTREMLLMEIKDLGKIIVVH